MKNKLIENKEFIKSILTRLDSEDSNLCLYDSNTHERINVDDNLKKIIKNYYKDKLYSSEINLLG